MIGDRLRQTRLAARLTLRQLAERVGDVTAQAISKFENGRAVPRQSVLVGLARALNVTTTHLLSPPHVSLAEVKFRKRASLPETEEESIKSQVRECLEPQVELAELLGPRGALPYAPPRRSEETLNRMDEVERRAEDLRDEWGLGTDPIKNVIETLEDRGVHVVTLEADARFDELACIANGKHPVVVLKAFDQGKGDRQRLSALHGFAHHILCAGDAVDEEKMCHRFAAAVLVPQQAAERELGAKRTHLDLPHELKLLKEKYGLSIGAWLFRARDLGIITQAAFERHWRELSIRGWRAREPGDVPLEAPRRHCLAVQQAVAEGLITPARAAEYLGELPRRARAKPSDTELAAAARCAREDYSEAGDMSVWSQLDNEDFLDT